MIKRSDRPKNIPLYLQNCIIDFDPFMPKSKSYKITIKCSNCGHTRQSNSFDVLTKQSTLCNSCKQKNRWKDTKREYIPIDCSENPNPWENLTYREKQIQTRSTKEYRKNMKTTMQNSQAWKDKQPIRNKALKEYWSKIRGCKFEDIKDLWYMYRRTVYKMSESSYKKFTKQINSNGLPRGRGKYHLDHKYSVLEGFKNNIPPYIISHYKNLQMLPQAVNISKDYRSSISMNTLFSEVLLVLEGEKA